MARSISMIARDIRKEWKKPYFGAVPYLEAMGSLDSIEDHYIFDSAKDIVLRFLCNAGSWRGDAARKLKAELKELLK